MRRGTDRDRRRGTRIGAHKRESRLGEDRVLAAPVVLVQSPRFGREDRRPSRVPVNHARHHPIGLHIVVRQGRLGTRRVEAEGVDLILRIDAGQREPLPIGDIGVDAADEAVVLVALAGEDAAASTPYFVLAMPVI